MNNDRAPRVTNRVREYEARRAIALNYEEKLHDLLTEKRLRDYHGRTATGFKAALVRRTLTQLALRSADEQGAILP